MNPASLPKTVLVVGAGGREHALVRALGASPSRPRILCAPGNAGIAGDAACLPVKADDVPGLVALAQREGVDFVVVGPEVPLVLGLADRLTEAGIKVYGACAAGARLEASKTYTKQILIKYGIPTAAAGLFSETAPALEYIRSRSIPIVVKADGLAAGKGVVVATTLAEAESAVHEMIDEGKFGAGGRTILVEDCMVGEETSILVVVAGRDYYILPTSQDHKRVGDGDTGPNTGGMGAYSPAEVVTPAILKEIEERIVRPSVEAIAAEGISYCGTLFVGIMLTNDGPKVIEFNARLGDPETQAVLPRITSDVLELLWAAANGRLAEQRVSVSPKYTLCVVIAARGYPGSYPSGDPIIFPNTLPNHVFIYHAGTATDSSGQLVTSGGRVLGVTATGSSLAAAAASAYTACDAIRCSSKYYRRDIGARQLNRT